MKTNLQMCLFRGEMEQFKSSQESSEKNKVLARNPHPKNSLSSFLILSSSSIHAATGTSNSKKAVATVMRGCCSLFKSRRNVSKTRDFFRARGNSPAWDFAKPAWLRWFFTSWFIDFTIHRGSTRNSRQVYIRVYVFYIYLFIEIPYET